LVLQVAVPPSAVVSIVEKLLAADPKCNIQAHAASGIVVARFSKFTHGDLTAVLAGNLRPAATHVGGHAIVVRSSLDGITPHLVWGGRTDAVVLLERIKQKFDPKNILNPGRFIY
jgi:glycolate oxidase FAD binding subunit